ncbi:MAG: hypothetical protein JWQ06_1923 [Mucilaginibacter sp.]|nr:hypothetical protein [Mucilaginibacter sp.]
MLRCYQLSKRHKPAVVVWLLQPCQRAFSDMAQGILIIFICKINSFFNNLLNVFHTSIHGNYPKYRSREHY